MKCLCLATAILGLLPYLFYVPARLLGALPDEATWDRRGGNGGPWHLDLGWNAVIAGPTLVLVLLALLSLVLGVSGAVTRRRGVLLAQGLGLAAAQLALAMLHLDTVYWAVE